MASFFLSAALLLSSASFTAAQSTQTTWSAIIIALPGDSTPIINSTSSTGPILTPLGAQQLFSAASVLRSRYITGESSDVTNNYPLQGISRDEIVADEVYVLAPNDANIVAGAQAFMQGLYPPIGRAGTVEGAGLSNGSLAEAPLGGYQYARIEAISSADFNYIWLDGNAECPAYQSAVQDYFDSPTYAALLKSTLPFYTSLTLPLFPSLAAIDSITYYNAYNLYDYVSYLWAHNSTIRTTLPSSILSQLRHYASLREFSLNGGDSEIPTIAAISGSTLAGRILTVLENTVFKAAGDTKMNVLFGDHEPFLAFSALAGLASRHPEFGTLPEPGSVMVFELFSPSTSATGGDNGAPTFPDISQLYVRFLFRNGTSDNAPLLQFPLFGRGNSEADMPWTTFMDLMNTVGTTMIGDWCNMCQSDALYCASFTDSGSGHGSSAGSGSQNSGTGSSGSSGSGNGLNTTTAGVLGAFVTLAFCFLLAGAAALFGRVRLYRRESGKTSGLGGFKGAEKLASDTDLAIKSSMGGAEEWDGKTGASVVKHERVGSWEMGSQRKDLGLDGVMRERDLGDERDGDEEHEHGVSPFADPVRPVERV